MTSELTPDKFKQIIVV